MRKGSITLLALLLLHVTGFAQKLVADSALKQTTIEVIQAYKPEVTPLTRPTQQPELPPVDTARPSFSYTVPQQTLYYTYRSMPLRPLTLMRDTVRNAYPGYVKLGGGNLSTLFFEAGSAHLKGDNYKSVIHVSHLGQEGELKYQKSALSSLRANADYTTANHLWSGGVEAIRNQYFNYGYDHSQYDFARNDVRNTYTGLQVNLSTQNIRQATTADLFYQPAISAAIYGDGKDNTERTFNAALGLTKQIDTTLSVGLAADIRFAHYKFAGGSITNNLLQFRPYAHYSNDALQAHLGLSPTFGRAGAAYLLPDLYVSYKLANAPFLLSAGWQAELKQNTFRELTTLNPFLSKHYLTAQTRKDEIYGSAAMSIGNHLSFGVKVGYMTFNNLPLFLNDTGDAKSFYIVYDNRVNAIAFQPHIRYQIGQSLTVTASGKFYNFVNHTQDRVWHVPTAELKGDIAFSPVKNLIVNAYVIAMDGIYARNTIGNEVKLPTLFDAGGGAEYQFVPRLSAFGNVTNIFNAKNQRWLGYNAYGFNIFGGLRLSF